MWALDEYFPILWGFFQKRKAVKGELMDSHENNPNKNNRLQDSIMNIGKAIAK